MDTNEHEFSTQRRKGAKTQGEFESPRCPQCGNPWLRLSAGEQMCQSCRRDLLVMRGEAIGPARGQVERAKVEALAARLEKEAAGYRAQIEEAREKGLACDCTVGVKTGLEWAAKELRGLLA
jgi:uncharacterized Zn finger protein (UPF0148 family)